VEGDGKEPRLAEPTNVRFGSQADICAISDVRFPPNSDCESVSLSVRWSIKAIAQASGCE
jgi:hypothetical protein